jgi:4-aminobutyrate aminotransferase-like enzyme
VVKAVSAQLATLNTNSRYLQEAPVELAERLLSTLPERFDRVLLVNSGSEANDLAWRIASTVTGGDAGLVTDWAYHGVTARIAEFSPSEWNDGVRPDGVETFAAPNTYRGPLADAGDAPAIAAEEVRAAVARLRERGRRPAALYIDSLFSADGIFTPDPGIVRAFVTTAREAGALWVADEVQSGHGRTGGGLWGFSAWGITPDFVTLGKPMGNGHPIAAVVTRSDLVDRFAKATTFFSTFGGNPVACAAALAVLDVIEDEGLVARSAMIGEAMRAALSALADGHPAIGDVRGRGLIAGLELVLDSATREPDPDLAAAVRNEMRERGVLIGTTGRSGNVLKIRPPLAMTAGDADIITATLDQVLTSLRR